MGRVVDKVLLVGCGNVIWVTGSVDRIIMA